MDSQAHPTKLLFGCSQNRIRSLTAEKLFHGVPGFKVRSAGTQPGARIVITDGHIGWADIIFAMEKSHLDKLHNKFPESLLGKHLVTLHIPDDYKFMQPELIDELRAKLAGHIDLPDDLSAG
ncbi:MAG TPA: protein tyrosine phosphatase [Verrucomicrobiae bacterium]|nr:protein tyrosine phosphatase [Verrucomicrobiae bacterium]